MATLAPPLRQLRREKHLNQVQLAQLCYTSQAMISIWERSETPPTLSYQVHLANAFGMTLQELQEYCSWPVTPMQGASHEQRSA